MTDNRPVLSSHDTAIWHSIHICELIDVGSLESWQSVGTTFVLRNGPDERALVTGPFRLNDYVPVGDGTYTHNSGMMLATGRGGLAMSAGFMAVQAAGNAMRKQAAAAAAQPRWHVIEQGQIWVTQYGFYRATPHGLFAWTYGAIGSAQMVGPGALWMTGDSTNGPVSWILESDWAELILLLWARAVGIDHPQTSGPGWIPPGWPERVIDAGQQLPRALSASSPLRGILPPG